VVWSYSKTNILSMPSNCTVTDTGNVTAAEVAQLYMSLPNSPTRQLRGFQKRMIDPGASKIFSFGLTRRDLSIWIVIEQAWVLERSTYNVSVGASVLDIKLQGSLAIQS
jgi:beta-glucosidase